MLHAAVPVSLGTALLLVFILPFVGLGEEQKGFGHLSSEEMKAQLESGEYLKGLAGEERAILQGGFQAIYQSRLLAEQYFAATGEARRRLAGAANADAARNVVYEIVETRKLTARMEPPPKGGKMDLAWLSKHVQGAYEGLFLVKPSDGKPLEQYRMVFGVAEGKRHIEKVEKDAAFDAAVYAQDIEKEKIVEWAETALKGSRENVLSHLPKAEYPYLNAPVFERVEVDVEPQLPSSPPVAAEAAVSNWKGSISLFFKPEASKFKMAETLLVEIEKKGDSITIVKCQRDEKFAKAMQEKANAAQFIVKYVSQPNRRAKWLAPGGSDDLPRSTTAITPDSQMSLPFEFVEQKRIPGVPFAGDPGQGVIFEVVCRLKEDGVRSKESRYLFRVVITGDQAVPFLMLRVVPARP